MYTLTTGTNQCTRDIIPPNAPIQEVGYWSAIILHTAHVFIALTPGVPFKILVPPMPPMTPMIRPAIIEYAPVTRQGSPSMTDCLL